MTGLLANNDEAMAALEPPSLTLKPHQQDGVRFALDRLTTNRVAMFADVMGLGKTIEAIATANVMQPRRILVVCPASVLFTWRREIWNWQTLGLPVLLVQASRDTSLNHDLMRWGADGWYIINYDIVGDYPEIKNGQPWDLLILDESHKLKNPEAIRTRHVFGSNTTVPIPAEKALLLTGTPMINYVHDLYTQLHYIDPVTWPSLEQFVADQYFPGYKIISPSQIIGDERNLLRLRRQLQSVMIRRPKSVLRLPPKEREIVEVGVEDIAFWSYLAQQRKSLTQLQLRLMRLSDERATEETRAEIQALHAMINGKISDIRHQVGIAKLPAVIDYLRGCAGKTLVFAHHHDVIERLVEALRDRGVSWFTGGSSLSHRERAANRFRADPSCSFFIGNIEAAGQGITLTEARHVVFAEPDWRGTYLEQAEDRAHRIGQEHPVLVTYLLLNRTEWSTDRWMESKAKIKQAVIDTVLGSSDEENIIRNLARQPDRKHSEPRPHKDERMTTVPTPNSDEQL